MLASIVTKNELVNIFLKVLFGSVVIDTNNPSFQQAPEPFYRVCMNATVNVLTFVVLNDFMVVNLRNSFVPAPFVSIYFRVFRYQCC